MRTARVALLPVLILVGSACEGEGLVALSSKVEVLPVPLVMPATPRGVEVEAELTVRSTGEVALVIEGVSIEGTDEWTLSQVNLPLAVEPGGEQRWTVRYRPTGAPLPTQVLIRSNDPKTPEFRVPIETTLKTGPVLMFCANRLGASEVCTQEADSFDLGVVPVGQVVTATLTVKSVGDVAAPVDSVAFTAGASPALSLPPITDPFTLEVGAERFLVVRYAPTEAGAHQAKVDVRASDRAVTSPNLTLTAQATAPAALCATPTTLDFGSLAEGATQELNFELTACGGAPVQVSAVQLSRGGPDFSLLAGSAPLTLQPGDASLSIPVRFAPNAPGSFAGQVTIASDAGSVNITLLGDVAGVGTLDCNDGSTGRSWQDSLLPREAPVQPGASLPVSSGAPAASCTGDATLTTDPTTHEFITSNLAHQDGRWYFEATVEEYEAGWSTIGAFASPASVNSIQSPFVATSGAEHRPGGVGVVSVALDLEAARAYFYVNGAFDSEVEVLILPGVGAFHVGGVSMAGNKIRFNYGQDPFSYGVPPGYEAWNGGTNGGACVSDPDLPANPAPVEIRCDNGAPCGGTTTFLSDARGLPELVVLGVYDSGSVSSWTWGTDAQGNPIEVPVGPGQNGSILVEINRPGPVALVLSSYEPTDWTIRVAAGSQLASVSLYGMHLQTLTGLDPAVPVDMHTICTGGDGGNCPGFTGDNFPIAPYQWPYDTGGGDTQGFIDFVEARFCLPLKIFAGGYLARRFTVN
ncbi:MAG: choice-of-anchor D domain-containing protein [Deltaproteobacteria bacterium]|nr:choice-of-anchor D domain-containing protein [Deltaproteobacteria bacterium]